MATAYSSTYEDPREYIEGVNGCYLGQEDGDEVWQFFNDEPDLFLTPDMLAPVVSHVEGAEWVRANLGEYDDIRNIVILRTHLGLDKVLQISGRYWSDKIHGVPMMFNYKLVNIWNPITRMYYIRGED